MIGCVLNVSEMRERRVFGMDSMMRNFDGRERPASLSARTMRSQDERTSAARAAFRAEKVKRGEVVAVVVAPVVRRRAKVA